MSLVNKHQPWLNSVVSDSVFILAPPFFSLLLVSLFPREFKTTSAMPIQNWLILVVFVDVAHVYSTLYKTYFRKDKFRTQSSLLIGIPLICYFFGVVLYHMDSLWFWRVLAYLAVFHFIRQQYGFMRLYSRTEQSSKLLKLVDELAIYSATIYPILYWHIDGKRNFSWFVDGDFYYFSGGWWLRVAGWVYVLVLILYFLKELWMVIKFGWLNIPKNLVIIGTVLSWYIGIVYFNGDMAFTTLNVISHGIPYMALIWFFEKRERREQPSGGRNRFVDMTFGKYGVLLFVLTIALFAYIEEGLWDGLVWKEHSSAFGLFNLLPQVDNITILTLLVPMLALPQATHYVLDGFIWRKRHNKVER